LNDIKHGKGIVTWPDGRWFKGTWVDGKHHGPGQAYNNKVVVDGMWEAGKRVK